jgi:predicted HicB family RNase H-like nuclease
MKDVLKYEDFIGSVHFSAEDELFYGKLEGVDDTVTFEGSSVAELKMSFQEAVGDYVEICKSLDKEPHKSFKGTFNVRIKPVIHRQAAFKSAELGLSLNQFVEQAISDKLVSIGIDGD